MKRLLLGLATAGLTALAACEQPTTPLPPERAATLNEAVSMLSLTPRATGLTVTSIHPPGAGSSGAVAISPGGKVLITSNIGNFIWSAADGYVPVPIQYPQGINDAGVVVGWSGQYDQRQAWRWSPHDGLQPLPVPPGFGASFATDINNAGEIVGGALGPPPGPCDCEVTYVPIVWWEGVPEVLSLGDLNYFFALNGAAAINERGDIVGGGLAESYGFILYWADARVGTDPLILTPPSSDGGAATDINYRRQITATGFVDPGGEYDGSVWSREAGFRNLTPPNGVNSAANAVNDAGVVAGHLSVRNDFWEWGPQLPIRWTEESGIEELPLLPGTGRGDALDINSDGHIVGTLDNRAVIWSPRCRAPGLELVAWNGPTPGTISLSQPDVHVVVFDIEPHIPPHNPRAAIEDLRLGEVWESASTASSYRLRDVDNDGRRDVQMRFDSQRLVDEGNLSLGTSQIMIWGRDPVTEERYCGTTPVTVVP